MRVAKDIYFCAGHRLYRYEGKCASLHGHNYRVEVEIANALETSAGDVVDAELGGNPGGRVLDDLGMVADFGDLDALKDWIDSVWDHGMLMNEDDPAALWMLEAGQKLFTFKGNPTAEMMALHLMKLSAVWCPQGCIVKRITVWETEKCRAIAMGPNG